MGAHGAGSPRNSPSGGPARVLTALAVVFCAGVALFAVLTAQVSGGGRLVARDWAVLGWFQRAAAAHPALTGPAQVLSDVGNVQVAVPLLLAAVVAAGVRGRRSGLPLWWLPPLAAVLAMALVPLVVGQVKSAVARPAPGKLRLGPDGYAGFFPSGHTATSSVAVGCAALLVLPAVGRAVLRRALYAAALLLAAGVGAGLVWHGYHWPLDVVASWCLAASLLSVVAAARVLAVAAGAGGAGPGPGGGRTGRGGSGPESGESGVGGESEVDPAV
ncbi:phosphatase PAP2 family protein [Streptomyces sp. NPDC021224]|uniref:phosphatase PAP2 family protein n=1 Tax=unclassified Streptomyces TaxID=2593676 RepID=UPI0037937509